MKLFHFAQSSSSYRIRIALALKDIDVEYVAVDLDRGENRGGHYQRVNPQGLVPCLETDDGTRIGQSLAIIDYLEALAPAPGLYPASVQNQALAKNLALIVACEAQPFQAKAAAERLERGGFDEAAIRGWRTYWLDRALAPLEQFAATRSPAGEFFFSERPGVVECYLVPQLHNVDLFGLDLPDLPHLREIERRCLALPAFQRAHPDAWR